jgi:alpha-beta hydrolase superfamily lysophospholipase
MKRFLVSLLLVCSLAPLAAAQSIVDGYWSGSGTVGDEALQFAVTFRTEAGVTRGFLDNPDTATSGRPLTGIAVDGAKVRFTMPNGAAPIPFEATVSGETMRGTFRYGPATLSFALTRSAPVPPPYREEEVFWRSGGITLRGSLLLPKSAGPHRAIVFQHAARPNARDVWRFYADRFARAGVACLIYDNRGAGASTGDYRTASFDDLAQDGAGAVALLRARKDIDGKRIGIFAASQGGWVAPLVATRSHGVSFVMLVSGPAVPLARNIQYEAETKLRAAHVPEAEIVEALALKEQVMQRIASHAPADEIDRLIATEKPAWSAALGLPRQDDWMRAWFPRVLSYDPAPVWRKVRVPVLDVFGAADRNVNTAENAPLMQSLLGDRATIKVFAGADHSLLVTSRMGRPHLADGFVDYLIEWLLAL